MTGHPLHLTTPDELPAPSLDSDSALVLNDAVDALARLRTPYWLGDSGVRLHTLASLIAEAQRQLPQAISDARDQELTWEEIAQLLNVSPSTAQRRTREWRRTP